jgi:hypothetical protein
MLTLLCWCGWTHQLLAFLDRKFKLTYRVFPLYRYSFVSTTLACLILMGGLDQELGRVRRKH